MRKSLLMVVAVCLVIAALCRPARADILGIPVAFKAPDQSLWGPFGAVTDFGKSGSTGQPIGFSYDAKANMGTIQADVAGAITADYTPVCNGPTTVALSYQGTPGGSQVQSRLGASVSVDAFVYYDLPWPLGEIDVSWPIYDWDSFLDPTGPFGGQLGQLGSAYDQFAYDGVGLSKTVTVGTTDYTLGTSVDILIGQTTQVTPESISGSLVAKGPGGERISKPFGITAAGPAAVSFDLTCLGDWDFCLENVKLAGTAGIDFNSSLGVRIDYFFGSWEKTITDFDNYTGTPFALAFNAIGSCGDFTVQVVPEPLGMALLGLGALVLLQRRRRS